MKSNDYTCLHIVDYLITQEHKRTKNTNFEHFSSAVYNDPFTETVQVALTAQLVLPVVARKETTENKPFSGKPLTSKTPQLTGKISKKKKEKRVTTTYCKECHQAYCKDHQENLCMNCSRIPKKLVVIYLLDVIISNFTSKTQTSHFNNLMLKRSVGMILFTRKINTTYVNGTYHRPPCKNYDTISSRPSLAQRVYRNTPNAAFVGQIFISYGSLCIFMYSVKYAQCLCEFLEMERSEEGEGSKLGLNVTMLKDLEQFRSESED
ncbi:hypothetical protein C0J52_15953 [Blattella germanica]|nr:hypothetical protein C0J52_15953 [Blattella germanica]